MFRRIPFDRVNWPTSSFLIGTFFMSLTLVPAYIWRFGLEWFQIALFLAMFFAVGFSITLGYHRLYSHLTFQAHWSVRLFTVIFGAAAFENSVLLWACEHRAHHKRTSSEVAGRMSEVTRALVVRNTNDSPKRAALCVRRRKFQYFRHFHFVSAPIGERSVFENDEVKT